VIKAARIYEQDLIKTIMNDPINMRAISGVSYSNHDWPIADNIIYLGMFIDRIIGLFIGVVKSNIVLEVHVAMHPSYYCCTDMCYETAINWVRDNTDVKKLTGQTPTFNRLAIKCNERNGFEREGVNKNSFMRNGILYDQVYFGRCL
jgi:hypothetical protein